jgi:hypothetical protein
MSISSNSSTSTDYNIASSLYSDQQRSICKDRRAMRKNYMRLKSKAAESASAAEKGRKQHQQHLSLSAVPSNRANRIRKPNLPGLTVSEVSSDEYRKEKVKEAVNDRKIRNRLSAIESRTRRIEHAAMLETENVMLKGNIAVLRSRLSLYENPAVVDNFLYTNSINNQSSNNNSNISSNSSSNNNNCITGISHNNTSSISSCESSSISTISSNSDYKLQNHYFHDYQYNNSNHGKFNSHMGDLGSHFNHYTNEPAVFAY